MKISQVSALSAFFFGFCGAAHAFDLGAPVDCTLGDACFIQNYVDHQPGPGQRDVACGHRSYDGHKGTDFAVPDLATMRRGVDVLAVADGIVSGIRDGMEDIATFAPNAPDLDGRDCGNGVYLKFGGGWAAQYCHMKKGSVAVRKGDQVRAGERLGHIGLSGNTEFPHLHIQFFKDKETIDPFNSSPKSVVCGTIGRSLWDRNTRITYVPGGVVSAGLRSGMPSFDEVKEDGSHEATIPATAPVLAIWGYFHGTERGDVLVIDLDGPNGEDVLDGRHEVERDRATSFRSGGRRLRAARWPPGQYTGRVALIRNGETIDERSFQSMIR